MAVLQPVTKHYFGLVYGLMHWDWTYSWLWCLLPSTLSTLGDLCLSRDQPLVCVHRMDGSAINTTNAKLLLCVFAAQIVKDLSIETGPSSYNRLNNHQSIVGFVHSNDRHHHTIISSLLLGFKCR